MKFLIDFFYENIYFVVFYLKFDAGVKIYELSSSCIIIYYF